MMQDTMENGRKVKIFAMDLVHRYGPMDQFTRDAGRMMKQMDRVE
jgi:hypothetical protein